ncbi:MAG: hypothetical protein LBK99_14310 [Opitutaceae bacterium]|nr:hypothetical protein [Opitutaceae bacterium]
MPDTGELTFRLHAHVLVTAPKGYDRKRSKIVRGLVESAFRFDCAGAVRDARKLVTYAVHPAEFAALGTDAHRVTDELSGLRLTCTMGTLRRLRRVAKSIANPIFPVAPSRTCDGQTAQPATGA